MVVINENMNFIYYGIFNSINECFVYCIMLRIVFVRDINIE